MKNLTPFSTDCFLEFNEAHNRKNDGPDKAALTAEIINLRRRFAQYENHFAANTFENVRTSAKWLAMRTYLTSYYDYSNAAVLRIRQHIEDLQPRNYRYTCQYCTLESNETMDHFLDQSKFPEFSLHAKNLLPCCSNCNTKKGDRLFDKVTGERLFLNLYTDPLPNRQYLACDVGFDSHGDLAFTYRLRRPPGIPNQTWDLIESHYHLLNLCDRMNKCAITFLTEFLNTIKGFRFLNLSKNKMIDAIRETIAEDRVSFGKNYWKCVMREAAIRSPDFWLWLKKQLS